MGFTNSKGKKLSQKEVLMFKKMYVDIIDGYLDILKLGQQYSFDEDKYQAGLDAFLPEKDRIFSKFDEKLNSNEFHDIETFFNGELINLYNAVVNAPQNARIESELSDYFGRSFINHFSGKPKLRDTKEGIRKTLKAFKLSNKVLPGVEDMIEIDPSKDNVHPLDVARMSNSSTFDEQKAEGNQDEIDKTKYLFTLGTELSKQLATDLQRSDVIRTDDIFNAFSSINRSIRINDPNGGKIRADGVSAGIIDGVEPFAIPGHLYETMEVIADSMNKIKAEKDPLVKKSQAIQLAAFTYQMSISEHVFIDGNGRSCRLLADVILQSFGLPPHTPTFGLIGTGKTIGNEIDFEQGTKFFLDSVKISDNLLKINNLGEEKIKETANELIAEHFINPSVLGNMEPRDCINMAIQIKGDKFSIMDSIETFISADHLFSWNSDEYKDVINKAKAFSECLLTNPINSDKIEKATKELRKSIKDYEKHCELKPRKGNPTREKRLSAINNLKDGLDHLEASAKSLTEIEKKGPNIDARKDVAEDISLYKTQKIKEQQEHFKELRKDAPQEKAEKQVQKQQEPQAKALV